MNPSTMNRASQTPAILQPARLPDPAFWAGKSVLLTGHTGFKGAWAALWLAHMGARVTGLALAPETSPNLFTRARVEETLAHHIADLRDAQAVTRIVQAAKPDIVLHLGAQALVRRAYREPTATFATNVMGTAHLLDALFAHPCARAVLVITSDKVYANDDSGRAFTENDKLGGHDPYSASKAAAEMLVHSAQPRAKAAGIALSTARGGNVIGGGDYSQDRIVPDIVRAAEAKTPVVLRSPNATRPWQHVLDCLNGYFLFAEQLATAHTAPAPEAMNIGPDPASPISVAQVAEAIGPALGLPQAWVLDPAADPNLREMAHLALNPALARAHGITDRLPGVQALHATAQWYHAQANGADARALCETQIATYHTL